MRRAVRANRRDLLALMANVDLNAVAENTIQRCTEVYKIDRQFDVYVMVGVGGANAGELVVDGRGVAFVCLEHFTGRPNHETLGLGLKTGADRPVDCPRNRAHCALHVTGKRERTGCDRAGPRRQL